MRKIALIQLGYESNTMIEKRAVLQDLAPDGWIPAETVAARFGGTRTGIGGVLDAAAQHGAQVVAMDLLSRNGAFNAGGIVDGDVWRQAVEHICQQLAAHKTEYAGVCAAIHGTACADGLDDADGYFLRRVRQTVGDKPVVAFADLHAVITPEMLAAGDPDDIPGLPDPVHCKGSLLRMLRGSKNCAVGGLDKNGDHIFIPPG